MKIIKDSVALLIVVLACSGCANLQPISSDNLTLRDNVTGTMWARKISAEAHPSGKRFKVEGSLENTYGKQVNDYGNKFSWGEAQKVVQLMNNDRYAGYSDWRLPTTSEMKRLTELSESTLLRLNALKPANTKKTKNLNQGLADIGYFANGACWTSEAADDTDYWVVPLVAASSYAPFKRQSESTTDLPCPVRTMPTK